MGLNDDQEKLRQAEHWLLTEAATSDQWLAAWEHVAWVLTYTRKPELRDQAQKIADKVLSE